MVGRARRARAPDPRRDRRRVRPGRAGDRGRAPAAGAVRAAGGRPGAARSRSSPSSRSRSAGARCRSGPDQVNGIICGASNFAVDDLVVVALPGAVLAGGFEISARKTYGHVSDGMIASARELGIGSDHAGILVLPPGSGEPGDDARRPARAGRPGLRAERHAGPRLLLLGARAGPRAGRRPRRRLRRPGRAGSPCRTPAGTPGRSGWTTPAAPGSWCAGSTAWIRRRRPRGGCSAGCWPPGMRPISLIVDVTNYVMLELGQPLHAYDAARVRGAHRGPPGARRGEADHPGRRDAPARPGRPADHRPVRPDRAGRGDGRRVHRDRRGRRPGGAADAHRRADRGRALRSRGHRPRGPPAQAAQRGVPPLRAHRRPAAAAGGRRAGRAAAGRARRRRRWPTGGPTRAQAPRRPPCRCRWSCRTGWPGSATRRGPPCAG